MNNPEVQQIMGDPAMRMILEQMQTDPQVDVIVEFGDKKVKEGFLVNSSNCISRPNAMIDLTADKVSTFFAQLKILGIIENWLRTGILKFLLRAKMHLDMQI